jgi:hypothetical protein
MNKKRGESSLEKMVVQRSGRRRAVGLVGLVTAMLVLGAASRAEASCAYPKAYQVVLYASPNFTGACATLDAPGAGTAYSLTNFYGLTNAQIGSMQVGNLARAVLYASPEWTGGELDYEGGRDYPNVNLGANSSIIVQSTTSGALPTNLVATYPAGQLNDWSQNPQGLTHDSSSWFLTREDAMMKIPLTTDISPAFPCFSPTCWAAMPSPLAANYNHFGDPDVLGSFVFVPMEPSVPNVPAMVAVFNASDLSYVGANAVTNATPDSSGKYHIGWLAIKPNGGSMATLYTSNGAIDNTAAGMLQMYTIDLRGLGGQFMWFQGELALANRDASPLHMPAMQGGDVSDDGRFLYLSNGCCRDSSGPWGIRVFDLSTGVLQAMSNNGSGNFDFKFDNGYPLPNQEPEGIDYFDTRGRGLPHIPDSQLHVAMFSNSGDDVWLMHYSYAPPATHFGAYESWWPNTFDGGLGTVLADVDADGRADLVTIGYGYVGVVRSQGRSFGGYESGLSGWFWGPHGTFLCDVDGDKKADLVAATDYDVPVRRSLAYKNFATGGDLFGGYETWYGAAYYGSYATLCGDIDGDGRADLLVLNGGSISVKRSTGSSFGASETAWPQGFNGAHGNLLGDVDGDGKADLVGLADGYVAVLHGTGSTSQGLLANYSNWYGQSYYGAHGTYLADVDGDGKADLVALNDDGAWVIRSTGSSFVGPPIRWWGSAFYGTHGSFIGDIDGDARADMVAAGDGYIGAIRATP